MTIALIFLSFWAYLHVSSPLAFGPCGAIGLESLLIAQCLQTCSNTLRHPTYACHGRTFGGFRTLLQALSLVHSNPNLRYYTGHFPWSHTATGSL